MTQIRRLLVPMLLGVSHAANGSTTSPYGDLPSQVSVSEARASLAAIRFIAHEEAAKAGLPFDLVDAVIKIESDYRTDRVGDVGEIGLMQVRPATAVLLGFRGGPRELAVAQINIHYGATYLGEAWRLAKGDVCRTLMKYRAGHGEDRMSPLSVTYCSRARTHLAAIGSPLAASIRESDLQAAGGSGASATGRAKGGARFWTRFEARIKKINAGIEAKWRRVASR